MDNGLLKIRGLLYAVGLHLADQDSGAHGHEVGVHGGDQPAGGKGRSGSHKAEEWSESIELPRNRDSMSESK